MVPMLFVIGGVALSFVGLGVVRARRGEIVNKPLLILGVIIGVLFMTVSIVAIVQTEYPGG